MSDKTKKFEVRLESQTDGQFRTVNLRAVSAKAAREFCEAKEQELVSYELSPDELARVEQTTRFAGADEIDPASGELFAAGKVLGSDAWARGAFHAHYQALPYLVTDVKEL